MVKQSLKTTYIKMNFVRTRKAWIVFVSMVISNRACAVRVDLRFFQDLNSTLQSCRGYRSEDGVSDEF